MAKPAYSISSITVGVKLLSWFLGCTTNLGLEFIQKSLYSFASPPPKKEEIELLVSMKLQGHYLWGENGNPLGELIKCTFCMVVCFEERKTEGLFLCRTKKRATY